MQNETIIETDGLCYAFPDEKRTHTLGPISFKAHQGEFISIVGPSGCGKSTLLRLIAGVIEPTAGTITRHYKRIAMVFQNYALFPWLSAEANVAFGLEMQGVRKKQRQNIALEKLREVGLAGLEKRYPHELSGGQRQRIGVARALAINPELLLMDEPFSNLDSTIAKDLKRDILSLWSKYHMTVIMVNHLIADAIELSDRIIVTNNHPAKIVMEKEITLPRPRNHRAQEFFSLEDNIETLL